MQALTDELTAYYRTLPGNFAEAVAGTPYAELFQRIDALMTADEAARPDTPAVLLKARLHERIADLFEPVLFRHSPFYFEMGIKPAMNWGTPWPPMPGSWLFVKRYPRFWAGQPVAEAELKLRQQVRLDNHPGPADFDHHYFPFSRVLAVGLEGLQREAEGELAACRDTGERAFVEAAIISLRAVMRIADKFAAHARVLLADETDPDARRCLERVAATAGEVPRRPARTFYEGLAALWFLREVCGGIEALGASVIGHPDRMLIDLYRGDLAAGRLTRAEAEDLVARWLLPTDCKFDLAHNAWPETSTTLMLGGCDGDGRPVFNEITEMMIGQHRRLKLINPKLNCRYSQASPIAYLQLIADQVLAGHNVFALLNDDALIPANVKAGKSVEDCRHYGAGGCQETIVEGVEHSAGAYYYFNLPRILNCILNPDVTLHPLNALYQDRSEELATLPDFEAFYGRVAEWLRFFIRHGVEARRQCGVRWPEINPAPFFSAALADCLKQHRDYTAGGGRYNPSGISLCGLGTLVDSLAAIKALCFDERRLSLPELAQILKDNWAGHEALRARAIAVPKFGHGEAAVDQLAARLTRDLAEFPRGMTNERGGPVQLSFFVYYEYVWTAGLTLATPDGRRNGDLFSQGVSPGRLRPTDAITPAVNSLRQIDFSDYPGNAVLDLQLPLGRLNRDALTALIRTAGGAGVPTLQFNCVSIEQLREAQAHPERHPDLTVRISGLSARFTALGKDVQDEIIGRNLFV